MWTDGLHRTHARPAPLCPSRRSTPGVDWTSGLPTLFGGWIDWVILQRMGLAYFSSSIERLVPSLETWGEVMWP